MTPNARGKTTPTSTPGSFAPKAGRVSRATIDDDTTNTDSACEHCGLAVFYDAEDGVWRHAESESEGCGSHAPDGDDGTSATPSAPKREAASDEMIEARRSVELLRRRLAEAKGIGAHEKVVREQRKLSSAILRLADLEEGFTPPPANLESLDLAAADRLIADGGDAAAAWEMLVEFSEAVGRHVNQSLRIGPGQRDDWAAPTAKVLKATSDRMVALRAHISAAGEHPGFELKQIVSEHERITVPGWTSARR